MHDSAKHIRVYSDLWCELNGFFLPHAGELDSTKASAATLTAQLQLETADKQHLSSKLAESESMKSQLEAKVYTEPCISG